MPCPAELSQKVPLQNLNHLKDISKGASLQLLFLKKKTLLVFCSPLLVILPKGLLKTNRQNMMKQVWRGGTAAFGDERGSNFRSGTKTAHACFLTITAEASVIALLLRCLRFAIFPTGIIRECNWTVTIVEVLLAVCIQISALDTSPHPPVTRC